METVRLPPKISRSVSSALMFRFSFLSCRLFLLTYAQIFLTTSVRGSGRSPTTLASAALGWSGFMNAALGLRADFLAAGFLAAFLAGILGFSSWNGPPLLPKTGRTLTEDARPSKALSPSGDRLRALGPTTEPRPLSSPLRPGNAQDAGPFAPEKHRGARGRGGRKPLPRLLLRGEHQRLSAGREQPPRLEQLAREHRFAGRRRRLAQDETSAALRQRFRGKERLDHAQPVTAQAQRSGVAPEEGGLEEIAVLRDDLRLRPADSRGERQRAVAAAEGE